MSTWVPLVAFAAGLTAYWTDEVRLKSWWLGDTSVSMSSHYMRLLCVRLAP